MAFIPVANTILLTPVFLLPNSVQAVNTLWFEDEQAGVVAPRVAALATLYATWWQASMRAQVSQEISLIRVEARDMSIEDGEVVANTAGMPLAGTVASAALPAHTTIAISLRTGLAGRSRRGRLYHIGLSEGTVAGNFVSAAHRAALLTAYGALRSSATASDFTWSIVSRVSNGVPRTSGLVTAITSIITVDDRVDTQRRRLPGEGS